jgi:hypothetical protein
MKTTAIIFTFTILSFACFSQNCKPKKGEAKVLQADNGLYVFVDSTPTVEYKVLGTVKAGSTAGKLFVDAAEYPEKRDRLIKKAKKEFPEAEGVIIYFKELGSDTAEAIKFN